MAEHKLTERGALVAAALNGDDWTEGEKKVLEWQVRLIGGFYRRLIDAACNADEENLQRIGQGFPSLAAAVYMWKNGDLFQRFKDAGLLS